jgi:hypothetical protein
MTNAERQRVEARMAMARKIITWLADLKIQSCNQWYHKIGLVDPFPTKTDGPLLPVYNRDLSGNRVGLLRQFPYSDFGAMSYQAGNCGEKSLLCYNYFDMMAKTTQGLLNLNNTRVLRCSAIGWDHAYVIVMDDGIILPFGNKTAADCGKTACVIDGWQEDWHFPNLTWWEMLTVVGVEARAGIGQEAVRINVRSHSFNITHQKNY